MRPNHRVIPERRPGNSRGRPRGRPTTPFRDAVRAPARGGCPDRLRHRGERRAVGARGPGADARALLAEEAAGAGVFAPELVLLDALRRGLGQGVPQLPLRRDLELRQAGGGVRAEVLDGHVAARDEEGLHLLAEDGVPDADDGDVGDPGVLAQRLLDQDRRDVLAAASDHVALAVDEVQPAVLVDPAEVAGQKPVAVQGGLRLLGIAEVRRHAVRRLDRDLADLPRLHLPPFVVEDVDLDAGDRGPRRAGARRRAERLERDDARVRRTEAFQHVAEAEPLAQAIADRGAAEPEHDADAARALELARLLR